jgi:hypothetical protein
LSANAGGLDFFARARMLDNLRGVREPSDPVADVLAQILKEYRYAERFFRDLENPAWLEPLNARGVFDSPPEPIEQGDGTWMLPLWPQAQYLSKMVHPCPSRVVDIALRWDTRNARVYWTILDSARDLPSRELARLVPAILRRLVVSHSHSHAQSVGVRSRHYWPTY